MYSYLLILTLISSTLLQGAQQKFRPFYEKTAWEYLHALAKKTKNENCLTAAPQYLCAKADRRVTSWRRSFESELRVSPKFKPFFDRKENETEIVYDIATSQSLRVTAIKYKENKTGCYMAEFALSFHARKDSLIWATISQEEESKKIFDQLEKAYKEHAILKEKLKHEEKPCKRYAETIKHGECRIFIIGYTKEKDGVTRSAERIVDNGIIRYGCLDSCLEDPEKLFKDLQKIYTLENYEQPA